MTRDDGGERISPTLAALRTLTQLPRATPASRIGHPIFGLYRVSPEYAPEVVEVGNVRVLSNPLGEAFTSTISIFALSPLASRTIAESTTSRPVAGFAARLRVSRNVPLKPGGDSYVLFSYFLSDEGRVIAESAIAHDMGFVKSELEVVGGELAKWGVNMTFRNFDGTGPLTVIRYTDMRGRVETTIQDLALQDIDQS